MTPPTNSTVVVVDDDRPVLASLSEMLSIAGFNAQSYGCPVEFLRAVPTLSPCCVITDVRMPRVSGLTLLERLRGLGYGHWPVIAISGHADVPMAVAAMQLGAATFLEKPFRPHQLIAAIHNAQQGTREHIRPDDSTAKAMNRYGTLTSREKEVLGHLISGQPTKAAAAEMGLSPRTVEACRASILRKMGVKNFTALAHVVGHALDEAQVVRVAAR